MKQKILIASENQELIEGLNYILKTFDFNTSIKKLKTIWVVYAPEDEFEKALMFLIPFVEIKHCPKNLFWAYNNKKQDTFENIIAIANVSTIEEFKSAIENLVNNGLTQ